MNILKGLKDLSALRLIYKGTKFFIRVNMLFARMKAICISFAKLMRLLPIIIKWQIPTVTYKSIDKCPFDNYILASKGDLKKLIVFGYNLKKALESHKTLKNQIVDRFGLNESTKKAMIQEAVIILAESEALRDARKENRYERLKEDYDNSKGSINELSLDEISIQIGVFFKDRNVDLHKMSVASVLKCYEIIKNGNN